MAKKAKRAGNAYKRGYVSYNYESNRMKKLERLAREQPNNDQVHKALKNIHYRRKKPNNKLGWVPTRWAREFQDEENRALEVKPSEWQKIAQGRRHSRAVANELRFIRNKRRKTSEDPALGYAHQKEHDESVGHG